MSWKIKLTTYKGGVSFFDEVRKAHIMRHLATYSLEFLMNIENEMAFVSRTYLNSVSS
ncbi:hypothetical protein GGGNBK_13900 [Sporosarcina sp. ANT_H38]